MGPQMQPLKFIVGLTASLQHTVQGTGLKHPKPAECGPVVTCSLKCLVLGGKWTRVETGVWELGGCGSWGDVGAGVTWQHLLRSKANLTIIIRISINQEEGKTISLRVNRGSLLRYQ